MLRAAADAEAAHPVAYSVADSIADAEAERDPNHPGDASADMWRPFPAMHAASMRLRNSGANNQTDGNTHCSADCDADCDAHGDSDCHWNWDNNEPDAHGRGHAAANSNSGNYPAQRPPDYPAHAWRNLLG